MPRRPRIIRDARLYACVRLESLSIDEVLKNIEIRRDHAELAAARGVYRTFDAHHDRLRARVASCVAGADADPGAAEAAVRPLVAALSLALQASLLIRDAPDPVADAFVAARLGPERGSLYGELPSGLALTPLVARA